MDSRLDSVINPAARYDVGAAVLGGIISGAMMWLLSQGMPWFASGMVSPTMIGRYLKPPGLVDLYRSAMTVAMEMGIAVVYTLLLAVVVTRFRAMWAVAVGGLAGAGLYLLNYLFFNYVIPTDWTGTELPVLVTHITFGLIAAGVYKGLASRKHMRPAQAEGA